MIVVFTDLDGTLLDHETYAYDAALPALAALKARAIPLVLASSKTEAEMRPIAAAIGTDQPMIVENGAGIANMALPRGEETNHYESLRRFLQTLPQHLVGLFEGFGDWSVEEVARRTGLEPAAAALARQRRFSEPGLFSGSTEQKADFSSLLDAIGYQAVQGGRFLTLMPKTSKAERMAELIAHYRRTTTEPVRSIALGDAPNDLAMLEAADRGVIIANPAHAPLPVTERERHGFISRSQKAGPQGWNESILQLVGTGF
ncbi:MAG: HAD-IIB family hydrolase [Arenimonas sp.]|nr:HAD-IIB family hydrolase [Rhizobium sp.]MBW8444048.1 HAD-IIB family hydrolase [Arenimonas sp.]